jgi:hypothetical protein
MNLSKYFDPEAIILLRKSGSKDLVWGHLISAFMCDVQKFDVYFFYHTYGFNQKLTCIFLKGKKNAYFKN